MKIKPEQNKFCIGIPTLNRFDLLLPSLLMYAMDFPTTEILIYDNGEQHIGRKLTQFRNISGLRKEYSGLANITVLGGEGDNIGVAGAWNVLCEMAFRTYSHALILNDDIYLKSTEYEMNSIADGMIEDNVDFFACHRDYDFSAFLISARCFTKVGQFDDNFVPAYLEDMDYLYRMSLHAEVGTIKYDFVPALNPLIFRRSSTLEKEPELISGYIQKNLAYYEKKWGGKVGEEKFKEKFGNK